MLRRLTFVILSLAIMMTQAMAVTSNGISEAFSELNYALTVDWDQKDQAAYQKHLEKFTQSITTLQAAGVTNQELMDHTISQIKDTKLANDVRTAFTLIQINKMSATEAQKTMKDLIGKTYNRGASWNSEAGEVIIAVAILGAIAYAIFYGVNAVCVNRCERECGLLTCYNECRETCWY